MSKVPLIDSPFKSWAISPLLSLWRIKWAESICSRLKKALAQAYLPILLTLSRSYKSVVPFFVALIGGRFSLYLCSLDSFLLMVDLHESSLPFSTRSPFPWWWYFFPYESLGRSIGYPYLYYLTALFKVCSRSTFLDSIFFVSSVLCFLVDRSSE